MSGCLGLQNLGWKGSFQQQLSLDELTENSDLTIARVVRVERTELGLLKEANSEHSFEAITISVTSSMPKVTVGDWVLLDSQGQFSRLLDRLTWLERKSAGTERNRQLIAANIDTVFIVSSMNQEFSLNRIERYLSLANETGIMPVVILTKQDLCEDAETYINQVQSLDAMLVVFGMNALDLKNLAVLNPWISAENSVAVIGSSGVGKSTLVNGLVGERTQATNHIREDDSKGRHTTTSRSIHLLPQGGVLIDTPGMRELQLTDCEQGVDETFSDIVSLAQCCQFSDCKHLSEPNCAVLEAIDTGTLSERRLRNYQKLMKEQAFNSASLAEKRLDDKRFRKMVKSVMNFKQKHR